MLIAKHPKMVCKCGREKLVSSKVCFGCYVSERTKHGMLNTTEYRAWQGMIRRCYDPKHPSYQYYGLRGISVCDEWRQSFLSFYEHIGPKTSPEYELDRINNNGNYEPGNIRWATKKEQHRNTRANKYHKFQGRILCITAWAEEEGIPIKRLRYRLKQGWGIERALTERSHANPTL